MLRVVLDPGALEAPASAVTALVRGGVVALPTDTLYGLSCRADRPSAQARIARMKERRRDEPFLVLVHDFDQLETLTERVPPVSLLRAVWPGPVTLVLPAGPRLSPMLVGPRDTVAVRLPARRWLRDLVAQVNAPLVSTSINRAGERPLRDPAAIAREFGPYIDLLVDGGMAPTTRASALVDLTRSPPELLRSGDARVDVGALTRHLESRAASVEARPIDRPQAPPYDAPMAPPREPFRLLFVCSGNTCRSPMAAAALRVMLADAGVGNIDVRSAGIAAADGAPATRAALAALAHQDITLTDHRSRLVTAELLGSADLVLTMEESHAVGARRLHPEAAPRVVPLHRFQLADADVDPSGAILDPYGQSDEAYAECLARIQRHLERVVDYLQSLAAPGSPA